MECVATTRKWGNSLGITLPKELVEQAHIKENEEVKVFILRKNQTGERLFGMLKGKMRGSGQEIKDMIRKELHHD
ncbi:AbrB/MazE/SpoVT family DNA-binding domain-containing protein [Candidatus Woesearchaeota archaeon]|nr:AbrB/MazE/SpoVT family DNA-binding domain-containing protein [Candidatus Woesearchaeota archaeon]